MTIKTGALKTCLCSLGCLKYAQSRHDALYIQYENMLNAQCESDIMLKPLTDEVNNINSTP